MKSFIAALRSLVLPYGRTSGRRLVLDGDNGEIDVYDALNNLVARVFSDNEGGGFDSRSTTLTPNLRALLSGSNLRWNTVGNTLTEDAFAILDTDAVTYASLLLASGKIAPGDKRAMLLLQSPAGGVRAFVRVTGAPGGDVTDLQVTGDTYALGGLAVTGVSELHDTNVTGALTTTGNVSAGGDVTAAGRLIGDNVRAGRVQTPAPGAGGGTTTVAVTFSSPTAATPRISIAPVTTVDPNPTGGVDIRAYVDNVSTSGFTIRCYRSSNSATNWDYQAIHE